MAARVRELIDAGAAPRDVVMLTRAATDLRIYERALEDREIPTYTIGGRGYWSSPPVMDLLAYLRSLANPLDELSYYHLLASPLVALSMDALACWARPAAREAMTSRWAWVPRTRSGFEASERGSLASAAESVGRESMN